ncbi:hypothetical protein CapIbe_016805 [Capra ibex]
MLWNWLFTSFTPQFKEKECSIKTKHRRRPVCSFSRRSSFHSFAGTLRNMLKSENSGTRKTPFLSLPSQGSL